MNMKAENQIASHPDTYRSLRILDELSGNDALTQRDLAKRLGIALGLVNSYIRNLAKKGYITIKAIPPKRYAYYLTPKGFTEKTRLTYDLLHDYTRIYREARNSLGALFRDLRLKGAKRIVFAGADEVAEIAYLTLQETGMELAGVVDGRDAGKQFFGRTVRRIDDIRAMQYDAVVIASYLRRDAILQELHALHIDRRKVHLSFAQQGD